MGSKSFFIALLALATGVALSAPAAAQFAGSQGQESIYDQLERSERYCRNDHGRYSDRRSIAACNDLVGFSRNMPSLGSGQFRYHVSERDGEVYALLLRGHAYIRAGRGEEAVEDFDRALTIYRDEPALLFGRCQANVLVNLDRALADCEASMRVEPSANALIGRGVVRLRRREYEAALADFEQGAALAAYAQYGRGLALTGLGQTAEGQAEMAAAVAQDEEVAAWFARLGLGAVPE